MWRVPSGVGKDEAEQRGLGPVAIVSLALAGLGEEGAVAAVLGLHQGDERVRNQRGPCLRLDGNEGIVEGVDHQRWHADAVQNARCGGTEVVVVREAKPE